MEHNKNSTRKEPLQKLLGTIQVVGGEVLLLGKQDIQDKDQAMRFVAGLGDGVYEVFGKYIHVSGYGYRLASLSIEFFSKEEAKWMERQEAEYPVTPY